VAGKGAAMRLFLLAIIAVLPGPLKRMMLRTCFGFRIGKRVRIGLAILDCRELTIDDDVRIGHGVIFRRTSRVSIGRYARIGPLNVFRGGETIDLGAYAEFLRLNVVNAIPDHDCIGSPTSAFTLGHGAVVTSSHWIDFTDRVTIGRRVILAGRNSSFWTHNRRRSAPIQIGDFCYIGSEVRFAPGAVIPDCSIVGLGSVVLNAFASPFTLIAGSPAKVVRPLTADDGDTLFGKTRVDLPDEPVPTMPDEKARLA
jgi:acetyltransferase-like isoleucine patch superfamily enzyme